MKPHIKIECDRGGRAVLFLFICLSAATAGGFLSFLLMGV